MSIKTELALGASSTCVIRRGSSDRSREFEVGI
jgi:hypothetical protein